MALRVTKRREGFVFTYFIESDSDNELDITSPEFRIDINDSIYQNYKIQEYINSGGNLDIPVDIDNSIMLRIDHTNVYDWLSSDDDSLLEKGMQFWVNDDKSIYIRFIPKNNPEESYKFYSLDVSLAFNYNDVCFFNVHMFPMIDTQDLVQEDINELDKIYDYDINNRTKRNEDGELFVNNTLNTQSENLTPLWSVITSAYIPYSGMDIASFNLSSIKSFIENADKTKRVDIPFLCRNFDGDWGTDVESLEYQNITKPIIENYEGDSPLNNLELKGFEFKQLIKNENPELNKVFLEQGVVFEIGVRV